MDTPILNVLIQLPDGGVAGFVSTGNRHAVNRSNRRLELQTSPHYDRKVDIVLLL